MKSIYRCPACNNLLEVQVNGSKDVFLWCDSNRCAAPDLNNHVEASNEIKAFVKLCEVYESLIDRK